MSSIQDEISQLEKQIEADRQDLHFLQALNFRISQKSISTKESAYLEQQDSELNNILNKLNG